MRGVAILVAVLAALAVAPAPAPADTPQGCVQVTGCATPLIAENELFGAQTQTPWSATNAQYRANVLSLLQALDALGATTALTIANPPYTGGDAADWWREAAQAAILVRQVYFTSPGPKALYALGPERASRAMRRGLRGLVTHLGQIGIPAPTNALPAMTAENDAIAPIERSKPPAMNTSAPPQAMIPIGAA